VGYSYAVKNIKLDEAEKMVRKALKLKPGQGYIEDSLGWIYYIRGDYETASTLLEQAVKLRPDEVVIVDHLGDVYVKLKKIEMAYRLYLRAMTLNPDKKTKASLEKKIKKLSKHELIKKRFPAQDK